MPKKRIEEIDENLKPAELAGSAELRWLSATDRKFTVRGLPWFPENGGSYSRMPKRAEGQVSDSVWELAKSPSSAYIAFRSDATRMAVRVENADTVVMPHMPATGSDGLVLYCGAAPFIQPWAVAVPDPASPTFERELTTGLEPKMREYRLYLPLYKELKKLDIGVNKGARILPPSPPRKPKPVVFYGTSITQGGCANTAGTDYVSTIGRLLNLDVINLGFSGNGDGSPAVAGLMSELPAGAFVVDYLANVTAEKLRKTLPRFVRILREKHPEVPILLVSEVRFWQYETTERIRISQEEKRDILIEYYVKQRKSGDANIHFIDGSGLIPYGADHAYVDGVHPTDHGFRLMAERLAPFIEQIYLQD
jgi:lysophospholipase L1-like esterase